MAGGGNNTIVKNSFFWDSQIFPNSELFSLLYSWGFTSWQWCGMWASSFWLGWTPAHVLLFLSILSFFYFCYVTSKTPQMLSSFFQKPEFVSFTGCTIQCFFSSLGLTECCLLATMAYDRYAAICNPLLYTAIVSPTRPVCADDGWSLYNWYPWLIDTTVCFTSAQFLWPKYYQPLLLWPASIISPLLLWNIFPTSHEICDSSDFWCDICLNHHAII